MRWRWTAALAICTGASCSLAGHAAPPACDDALRQLIGSGFDVTSKTRTEPKTEAIGMATDWMKFYYANPSPDRFVPELRARAESGSLDGAPQRFVTAVFFGQVMRANPARIHDWAGALGDLKGAARETLQLAAWLSGTKEGRAFLDHSGAPTGLRGPPLDILTCKVDDPSILDALWAYYFATGDPRPVRRIISAFDYLSDFGAAARFKTTQQTEADRRLAVNDAIFQAAAWSLEALMKEHAPLRAMCEHLFEQNDLSPNERIGLGIALQKIDPETWEVKIDAATGTAQINRKAPKR